MPTPSGSNSKPSKKPASSKQQVVLMTTQYYIPEGTLHNHHCENPKYNIFGQLFSVGNL
jgi:hypothetical protein